MGDRQTGKKDARKKNSQTLPADTCPGTGCGTMTGESILVVEDDGFIALRIKELFEGNG